MHKATAVDKLIADLVLLELMTAREKHTPLASAHEAYAVILEELDEFWEEVRKKRSNRIRITMREELVQVAAMAFRALGDLHLVGGCNSNS